MQKQKRLTDFYASPVAKESTHVSPRTPLFELDTNPPSAKRQKVFVKENDIRQATIDAGQKKIGGQYCKECDMMYCIDSITEMAMHDKYHNRHFDVARVKVSASQLNVWLRKECHYSTSRGCVFRVRPDSLSSLKRKAVQIVEELVNTSVGFCEDLSIWGCDQRRTVWVPVLSEGRTHFIAGIVITEPLESAQCHNSGKEIRDGDPIIGLNRIWIHPTARRKGIASETLDIIRQRYFTGTDVPKQRVAFSDPSDDGRRFAERYVGSCAAPASSFLVYAVTK